MNPSDPHNGQQSASNGAPTAIGGAANMSVPAPHPLPQLPPQSTTPMPSALAWSSQMSAFPTNDATQRGPNFSPQYSASTAAILERLQSQNGHAAGTAAFEAKRAEIMQNYVTSDKLPTPTPVASAGRRGRGGRVGTPSGLHREVGASPATGGSSGRGSGRGRGRGRGGRGGRGGKRKRNESEEESDVRQMVYISAAI
jgi:hypothetical protein